MRTTLTPYRFRRPPTWLAREDPPPPPPKLTDLVKQHPTLQADIDSLIEGRLAQERRRNTGFDPEKEKELETLRAEKADRDRRDLEAKGNYDKAVQSLREEHESDHKKWSKKESDLLNEIKHDRCYSQLVIEATGAGAVNPGAIAKLLSDRVTLDDDRKVVVLDDDGRPWFKSGKPVTVKDLVERHKHDEPWAYKAEQGAGEGSGAGGTGTEGGDKGGDATGLDAEIEKAKKDYEDAHTKARRSGSPSDVTAAKAARRTLEELEAKKKKKAGAAA